MNRRLKYLVILLIFSVNSINCQINFEKHFVSENINGGTYVCSSDIDNDGDIDILASLYYDNEIVWYENTDGLGTFSQKQTICEVIEASYVYCADINNDGFEDIVSYSYNDSIIFWIENINGQSWGGKHIVDSNIYVQRVIVSDLNGDNLNDIISSSHLETLGWYKNIDGQGGFGTYNYIDSNPIGQILSEDIDNDGDNDIVFNAGSSSWVCWVENTDGLGSFGNRKGVSYLTNIYSFFVADLDTDNNFDIGYGSNNNNMIAWSNNIESPEFFDYSSYNIIDTNILQEFVNENKVYAFDADNDGNIDVLSAISGNIEGKLLLYNNIEIGNMGNSQIIDTNVFYKNLCFSDINNDGREDIIFISTGKLGWYENKNGVNIEEIKQTTFSIYPNPTKNTITVQTEFEITKIELYNNLGQLVLTELNSKTINISNLAKGVYNCKVFGNNSGLGIEQIIIE